MDNENPASAIDLLQKKILEGVPLTLSIGFVANEPDAIRYVAGIGLYSRVTLAGGVWNAEPCDAMVAGSIFFATARGRLHSEPLSPGDPVVVALLDGRPDGVCCILSRANFAGTVPEGVEIGHRPIHEVNLSNHYFDRYPSGSDRYVDLVKGSCFVRLNEAGNATLQTPDGGTVDAVEDTVNGGWTFKIKNAGGAVAIVSKAGVRLASPDGQTYLQVDDDGITARSPGRFKTECGFVLLNIKPEDAPQIPARLCAYRGSLIPTTPVASIAPSKTVFIGD
jgi:hypothetical protein